MPYNKTISIKKANEFLRRFRGAKTFQALPSGEVWHTESEVIDSELAFKLVNSVKNGNAIHFMVNEGDGIVHSDKGVKTCRSSYSICGLRAFFVDTDKGDYSKLDEWCAVNLLPASIVVESSPGRFHYYWIILNGLNVIDEGNMKLWQRVQHMLSDIDPGFDSTMVDVSRVLKLPGFIRETKNAEGVPWCVETIESGGYFYDAHAFFNLLPAISTSTAKVSDAIKLSTEIDVEFNYAVAQKALEHIDPGLPEPQWIKVFWALRDGLGVELAAELFTEWSNLSREPKHLVTNQRHIAALVKNVDAGREITFGTLLHFEREAQVERLLTEESNQDNLTSALPPSGIPALGYGKPTMTDIQSPVIEEKKVRVAQTTPEESEEDDLGYGDGPTVVPNGKDHAPTVIQKKNYKQHPVAVIGAILRDVKGLLLADKVWWSYDFKLNHWKIIPEARVLEWIETAVISEGYHYIKDKKGKLYANTQLRHSELMELLNVLKRRVSCAYMPFNEWIDPERRHVNSNIIPVQNGLLDVSTDKLHKFTPEFFNPANFQVSYDRNAKCPNWEKAVDHWFRGDKDVAEQFQLALATTLLPNAMFKQIYILQGLRDSGKTTAVNIIADIFGTEYIASTNYRGLTSPFGFGKADKVRILLADDFPLTKLSDPEIVTAYKELSGGGMIKIEEKNIGQRSARATAKAFITTNDEPSKFKDPGGGLAGRVIFFGFYPVEQKDPNFRSKIEAELDGIFTWLMVGVRKILAGQRVVQKGELGMGLASEFADMGKGSFEIFLRTKIKFNAKAPSMVVRDLFVIYEDFCVSNQLELECLNAQAFSRKLNFAIQTYNFPNIISLHLDQNKTKKDRKIYGVEIESE